MINIQNTKTVTLLKPQIKNNGAFDGNTHVNVSGFSHARFLFIAGDTDVAVGSGDSSTAPKIEECDTSGGSYSDVSEAALSGVISATDDNKNYAIDVSLNKTHKKYMRVNAPTAGDNVTGANLAILCILSDAAISPSDAAGQGLEEHVAA